MEAVRREADRPELVSRWHQRLAVALDGPLETLEPGAERLAEVLTAYLDTQRGTTARPDPGWLFRTLLVEDLASFGSGDAHAVEQHGPGSEQGSARDSGPHHHPRQRAAGEQTAQARQRTSADGLRTRLT